MADPAGLVAIASPGEDWAALIERAGLWPVIDAAAARDADILILVDFGDADEGGDQARAVESLIDAIAARAPARIAVAGSADSSTLLAANRDVHALADLIGYRYSTDGGQDYDIVDLAEDQRDGVFPSGSALHDTPASAAWCDAGLRIVLATGRSGGPSVFAGALDTLIAALPRADKDVHYRLRRDPGEVVATLLDTAPPHVALLDGGDIRVASGSPLLADMVAAAKLGLDPFDVPLIARVAALAPPPPAYTVDGDLAPIAAARAPTPLMRHGLKAQASNEAVARIAKGWTRSFDATNFPLHRPLDAQAARMFGVSDLKGPLAGAQPWLAMLTGWAASSLDAWQKMFDKERLVRRAVSLDIDPAAIPRADYDRMVAELESLAPIAAAAPERAPGLKWRKWERAVLFAFERTLAVPFDRFVERVDVARAISFMNDYLGGTIVACEHDALGRPVRQAERNLYLPQPNYLALYGGKPIDVSKIEVARYGDDAHRLYWKTLHSANGSAEADDGFVTFSRVDGGTRVEIVGKQNFTLPPMLRVFDVSLFPAIEEPLTTLAYHNFFDRTLNNFEALVEGRDVRIGRDGERDTPHPSVLIEQTAKRLADKAAPLLDRLKPGPAAIHNADSDGFVHVAPAR